MCALTGVVWMQSWLAECSDSQRTSVPCGHFLSCQLVTKTKYMYMYIQYVVHNSGTAHAMRAWATHCTV